VAEYSKTTKRPVSTWTPNRYVKAYHSLLTCSFQDSYRLKTPSIWTATLTSPSQSYPLYSARKYVGVFFLSLLSFAVLIHIHRTILERDHDHIPLPEPLTQLHRSANRAFNSSGDERGLVIILSPRQSVLPRSLGPRGARSPRSHLYLYVFISSHYLGRIRAGFSV
jgi:hypothetical protein